MKELIGINWAFRAAAGMLIKDSLQSPDSSFILSHLLSLCSFTGLSFICVDVFDFCDFHTCTGLRACPDVQPALFPVDISCWRG